MSDLIGEIKNLLPEDGMDQIPPEMLEELNREIERNKLAVRMVRERELEAQEARSRAQCSQKMMENMMTKYEDMRRKLEFTKQTLADTEVRIESHNRLRQKVQQLRQLAEDLSKKKQNQFNKVGTNGVENKRDYAKTIQCLSEKIEDEGRTFMESLAALEKERNEVIAQADQKELEAKEAEKHALEREEEAKALKKKIEDMTYLLSERKNTLLVTEETIKKKAHVVDKVNKILDSKERRAKFVEKQNLEINAFDKKPHKK